MEACEEISGSYASQARKLHALNTKMEELHKTKDELRQAKEDAMQSWLDSKPLIDELEKLQTDLASAKNHSSSSVISEYESQLNAIHTSIRSKKKEELRVRTTINEMTRALEKIREEMEDVKLETEEERRVRSKLRQVLRLRRQTLRTLKLTLRAIRLESEAYGASAAAALNQISNHSQMDSNTVQLTWEDYYALTRRAKEEASLAEWRVAVSIEQKLVAKESRDLALRRLTEPYADEGSTKSKIEDETLQDENLPQGAESSSRKNRVREKNPFPNAQAKLMVKGSPRNKQHHLGKSKGNKDKKTVSKKKTSIFVQIRACFVQKIAILFG